jgi:hypothetical protein
MESIFAQNGKPSCYHARKTVSHFLSANTFLSRVKSAFAFNFAPVAA